MSHLSEHLDEVKAFCSNHRVLCGGILVACAGIAVLRWTKRRKADKIRKSYPRDTVIVHHLGRGPYAPSLVPFAVKLETYLRMANIPYQCDLGRAEKSSKQKWPWITYNGEDVADSAFIVQFLNKRHDVDLSGWLSAEQRAIALAFQRLAEENLYWTLVVTRWVTDVDPDLVQKIFGFPLATLLVKLLFTPRVRKMTWAQGSGRHSHEEVIQIARKDLTALSDYLGKKKFLMGDQPCEEDCAVFGQLSQLYWHSAGSLASTFKEFPQLVSYCERMKDMYWPDWDQCTTRGGTAAATR